AFRRGRRWDRPARAELARRGAAADLAGGRGSGRLGGRLLCGARGVGGVGGGGLARLAGRAALLALTRRGRTVPATAAEVAEGPAEVGERLGELRRADEQLVGLALGQLG